jgi:dolichyl-phosphate beta-glucosyltransferase
MKRPSCSIVIPAYNEEKRIPRTLDSIIAFVKKNSWDLEVIVVNDGSKDKTAEVVREYTTLYPYIELVDNPINCGKGKSIRDGVERAHGDVILFADADDSTPISDADKLLKAIEGGADIAIGSRWVERDLQVQPQPWYRRLNGRLYNLLMRSILGLDYRDTQNGFKAYTRSAAKTIFPLQKISGWGFDAEVLFLAQKFGFSVQEVPVEYVYYAEGSKIRPYRDGARMLIELFKVRWHEINGAYSEKRATRAESDDLSTVPLQERTSD